mmetsp:Transcript_8988/g.25680  ORF Transcript_8988/g.25680 Transcript_8988/m.25680 type:complete len:200 (-) Transcript_8988:58-657(-)
MTTRCSKLWSYSGTVVVVPSGRMEGRPLRQSHEPSRAPDLPPLLPLLLEEEALSPYLEQAASRSSSPSCGATARPCPVLPPSTPTAFGTTRSLGARVWTSSCPRGRSRWLGQTPCHTCRASSQHYSQSRESVAQETPLRPRPPAPSPPPPDGGAHKPLLYFPLAPQSHRSRRDLPPLFTPTGAAAPSFLATATARERGA